jgi:hypothetical protein
MDPEIASAFNDVQGSISRLRADMIDRLDRLIDVTIFTNADIKYLNARKEALAHGEPVEGPGESLPLRALRLASEVSRASRQP